MESPVARSVVALFASEDEDRLIALSEQLHNIAPSNIVLNKTNALPHVSLRQLVLPERNLSALTASVREQLAGLHLPTMTFTGVEPFGRNIFLMAEYTHTLRTLHDQLLHQTNALREGHTFSFDPAKVPADLQRNLREWGMALIGDELRPHVTLSQPQTPEKQAAAMQAIDVPRWDARVRSIGLVGCDDLGRATDIFEEWNIA